MIKNLALSLTLAVSASTANASAQQFISGLMQVLPPKQTPYSGKNNGRACAVYVTVDPGYGLYVVTVAQETKTGLVQKMSFVIGANSDVDPNSYIGRTSEFVETSVNVRMGQNVTFPHTYGVFAESTMGLDIRKSNETKVPTARKIWVTNLKAGKIAASGPACIINLAR